MKPRLGGFLHRVPSFKDAHDVGLLHDQEFYAVDLDFRARPLAEQNNVSCFDVDRNQFSTLIAATGADGNDLALHRLFLSSVWDDDASLGLGVFLDTAHDHAVMQWTKLHEI